MEERKLEIGGVVLFVDGRYQVHEALVTAIHGDPSELPCINLVYVVKDDARQDQYGRQIEHQGSVVHISNNSAGGYCWHWPDEEHHVEVKTIS
jgi:hypothetical protein